MIQNDRVCSIRTNQNQNVCCSWDGGQISPTLTLNNADGKQRMPDKDNFNAVLQPIGFNRERCGAVSSEDLMPTLQAAAGESGNNQPMVCQPILLESSQEHATVQTNGISTTLPASMGMGGGYVPMITDKVITTSHGGFMIDADDSGIGHTLQATDYKDAQTVCYSLDRASFNQGKNAAYQFSIEEEKAQTLVSRGPSAICARDYKGVGNEYVSENKCVVEPYQDVVGSLCARDYKGVVVRRLTPLECERLQGYPDGWTDIGDWNDLKGKKHKGEADAPRYKALGNSIALPFWEWLAKRMVSQYDRPTEMASLFDGIGGFPLVYSRCGCRPVWASEIEDFGIAVTKIHFGEE